MDKANGDAPSSPVRNRRARRRAGTAGGLPAAGLRLHRGQAAPEPASTPRRSFWAAAASAAWRISRPAAARPPLSFSSFTVGKRPAGAVELRLRQRLRRCQPFDNLPCCRHSSGWIASPPSPFGDFPGSPAVHGARRTTGGGRDAGNPLSERSLVSSTCSIPTRTFRSQRADL